MVPDTKEERKYTVDSKLLPLKYQQITALSSAVGLKPATHARIAKIQAISEDVRWRDDGGTPTATVGMVLAAGGEMNYTGDLTKIVFIETSASAELNVSYYF